MLQAKITKRMTAGALFRQRPIRRHLLATLLISVLFVTISSILHTQQQQARMHADREMEQYFQWRFLNWDDPLHRALLVEALNQFHPDSAAANRALPAKMDEYRRRKAGGVAGRNGAPGRAVSRPWTLIKMYLTFILAYLIVMALTYYGVQTIALYRFVRERSPRRSPLMRMVRALRSDPFPAEAAAWRRRLTEVLAGVVKSVGRVLAYLVLFAPAYVLAYSFKTRFDTDTFFFMVLLGTVSNGLLINYSQKFYTFLVAENRKGYVETARVKNLNEDYRIGVAGGIPRRALFALRKRFPGHVLGHIFANARQQYLPTLKEQASYLITGLVIIEMALNIQGHLCYELLRNILYKNYDVVLLIVLGIFWVVKATEIFTDYRLLREEMRLENED